MADSFGGGDGGGTNLKRMVATPAFLVIAVVAVAALAYLWMSRRSAGTNAAQAGVVANPLTGPAEGPQVLGTTDITGLQQQLSNLTQQVSTGFAANQPTTQGTNPRSLVAGTQGGTDAGWYFGKAPSTVPAGDTLVWKWTSAYLQNHPELGAGYGVGNGPPPGTPYPQYSWEWAVLPNSQVPGAQ